MGSTDRGRPAAPPAGARPSRASPDPESPERSDRDPSERWEDRLAGPVLVAALASVPAVFLTLLDEPLRSVGQVANWVSGGVLVAETVVLLAVSGDKRQWLSDHRWLVGLTVLLVPAVLLAVGPLQLLRLVRVFGALRIVRAGRVFRAAAVVRRRAGLDGTTSWLLTGLGATLVAAFVAVVLADPTSLSRQLLDDVLGGLGLRETPLLGWAAVPVAGAVLAAATFVVVHYRRRDDGRG